MYITNQSQLEQYLKLFSKSKVLAIDTEFSREHSYYPILSLVQISDGTNSVAIDMLKTLDFSELNKLLQNQRIIKVFHAARQDIEALFTALKIIPRNLEDTQLMALFLGYRDAPGLMNLVADKLGITLDKKLQFSNWLSRPLDQELIEYAIGDAQLVAQLYPIMVSELKTHGLYTIFKHECATLYRNTDFYPSEHELLLKFISTIRGTTELGRILNIIRKREELAKQHNVARSRIIRDEAIIHHIRTNKNPSCKYWNQLKMSSQLGVSKQDKITIEKLVHKHTTREKIDYQTLEDLRFLLEKVASFIKISKSLIANKDDLNKLALCKKNSKTLQSWRKECFGKYALGLADGSIKLHRSDGQATFTRRILWFFRIKLDIENELATTIKKWSNQDLK